MLTSQKRDASATQSATAALAVAAAEAAAVEVGGAVILAFVFELRR